MHSLEGKQNQEYALPKQGREEATMKKDRTGERDCQETGKRGEEEYWKDPRWKEIERLREKGEHIKANGKFLLLRLNYSM
jgi:hypothetical protein